MGEEIKNTPEPKVVEEVKAEIKKLGEGRKADKENYDELRKGVEALKEEVNASEGKFDALITDKVTKWSEDITTRQVNIDTKFASAIEEEKKLNKRCDDIEVALKRTPKAGSADVENLVKLEIKANEFMIAATVVKNHGKGIRFDEEIKFGVDEFKAYESVLKKFLRVYDPQKPIYFSADELKALSVGIDPDGGYTVTPVMSNRIVTRIFESDPVRQLASVEKISTDAIEWMVDYGEAGWGWEAETVAGPETTTPQIFRKRIPVHVIYAKPRASQMLLEDSALNIESWLADHVAKRFSRGEAAAFVSGNGVGKPRGFLTYADYDTAGTDQWTRIERQNMGNATALTADGFTDVKYRLIENYLQRGTWLMNRLTVAAAMLLKDGQGNYIWKPGIAEERHSTILGMDVRMSTTMPQIAADAFVVVIADWAEAYMVVDRLGITIQRDPYTQKPMVEFYTRKRVGGDVINFQAIKIGVIAV